MAKALAMELSCRAACRPWSARSATGAFGRAQHAEPGNRAEVTGCSADFYPTVPFGRQVAIAEHRRARWAAGGSEAGCR